MIRFRFREITSPDRADGYLKRWEIETRWFGVKLHKFIRSDAAPLHDHPWPFVSIILWGGYLEHLARHPSDTHQPDRYRRVWLSVAKRRATDRHRVELLDGKPVWTICFTGPRERDWYFYPVREPGHIPVRVPWRVAVHYGEGWLSSAVARGYTEVEFKSIDGLLRMREAKP